MNIHTRDLKTIARRTESLRAVYSIRLLIKEIFIKFSIELDKITNYCDTVVSKERPSFGECIQWFVLKIFQSGHRDIKIFMISKGHGNSFASPGFISNPYIIRRGWQMAYTAYTNIFY